jgi:hypothetical protein
MTFKCMNVDRFRAKAEQAVAGETIVYFTGHLAMERERDRVRKTADMALVLSTEPLTRVDIENEPYRPVYGLGLGVLSQRRVGGSIFDYMFTKSRGRRNGR